MDIEWDDLLAKKVEPPYKPEVIAGFSDTNLISKDFTQERAIETPEDSYLAKKKRFEGFTYQEAGLNSGKSSLSGKSSPINGIDNY